METCTNCGKTCEKIGKLNKIGVKKEFCCDCYSKIDKNFISEYWCEKCTNGLIDPFYEAKAYERKQLEIETYWPHYR